MRPLGQYPFFAAPYGLLLTAAVRKLLLPAAAAHMIKSRHLLAVELEGEIEGYIVGGTVIG